MEWDGDDDKDGGDDDMPVFFLGVRCVILSAWCGCVVCKKWMRICMDLTQQLLSLISISNVHARQSCRMLTMPYPSHTEQPVMTHEKLHTPRCVVVILPSIKAALCLPPLLPQ